MEALGFDPRYFLFQLINFVVLFLILKKFLHEPLQGLLEKRKAEIAEGLENAEKARLALVETEARQRELLEEARKEGRALLEQTRSEAKELEQRLQEEAQATAAQLLARTNEEIAAKQEEMRQELRAELANMVATATEKVLQGSVTAAEKRAYAEQVTQELTNG